MSHATSNIVRLGRAIMCSICAGIIGVLVSLFFYVIMSASQYIYTYCVTTWGANGEALAGSLPLGALFSFLCFIFMMSED